MDGYTHTFIAFPKDRLNGKDSQRRQALKKGGQQSHLVARVVDLKLQS